MSEVDDIASTLADRPTNRVHLITKQGEKDREKTAASAL